MKNRTLSFLSVKKAITVVKRTIHRVIQMQSLQGEMTCMTSSWTDTSSLWSGIAVGSYKVLKNKSLPSQKWEWGRIADLLIQSTMSISSALVNSNSILVLAKKQLISDGNHPIKSSSETRKPSFDNNSLVSLAARQSDADQSEAKKILFSARKGLQISHLNPEKTVMLDQ